MQKLHHLMHPNVQTGENLLHIERLNNAVDCKGEIERFATKCSNDINKIVECVQNTFEKLQDPGHPEPLRCFALKHGYAEWISTKLRQLSFQPVFRVWIATLERTKAPLDKWATSMAEEFLHGKPIEKLALDELKDLISMFSKLCSLKTSIELFFILITDHADKMDPILLSQISMHAAQLLNSKLKSITQTASSLIEDDQKKQNMQTLMQNCEHMWLNFTIEEYLKKHPVEKLTLSEFKEVFAKLSAHCALDSAAEIFVSHIMKHADKMNQDLLAEILFHASNFADVNTNIIAKYVFFLDEKQETRPEILPLTKKIIALEIQNSSSHQDILRGSSLATSLIHLHFQQTSWARNLFSFFFAQFKHKQALNDTLALEAAVEENSKYFLKLTHDLLSVSSTSPMSEEILQILAFIHKAVQDKFPNERDHVQAVDFSFLFLRLISPYLTLLYKIEGIEVDKKHQGLLVKVAKTIQEVVNRVNVSTPPPSPRVSHRQNEIEEESETSSSIVRGRSSTVSDFPIHDRNLPKTPHNSVNPLPDNCNSYPIVVPQYTSSSTIQPTNITRKSSSAYPPSSAILQSSQTESQNQKPITNYSRTFSATRMAKGMSELAESQSSTPLNQSGSKLADRFRKSSETESTGSGQHSSKYTSLIKEIKTKKNTKEPVDSPQEAVNSNSNFEKKFTPHQLVLKQTLEEIYALLLKQYKKVSD